MNKLSKLRQRMAEAKLDAVVATSLTAIRYLSGFTSDEAAFLVTDKQSYLLTDFRYTIQAVEQCGPSVRVVEVGRGEFYSTLERLLHDDGCTRLGFEEQAMTLATFRRYEALPVTLTPFSAELDALRLIKSEEEIASLQKAQTMADKAFTELLKRIHSGMTEKRVAAELNYACALYGSEGPSFDVIVGSGPNGAMCHAIPSERKLEKGDLVVLDFGCIADGYHSDMTRTFAVGPVDELSHKIYDIVREAQQRALNALKAGMGGRELDAVARDYISAQGYGEQFGHSLGHGFGLLIHEAPYASVKSNDILEAGTTITVEPGIYLEGKLGVRIEDCCIVREGGKLDLVSSTKELLTID